ncbi:class I SAM-dependent methyltransferase [Ilumatobacter sp.]|uniref:class I SAM-dependent methyltransferase n=1 Tax=Ilumatobacter sp. TaxID=1967498 RepID=UPI00375015E9
MIRMNDRRWPSSIYADWEAMSERYLPGRAELLASMSATLAELQPHVIVDLGCGPATVTSAVADAFPDAVVIGVDHDPALLVLARQLQTPETRLQIVDARVDGDWRSRVEQRPDAVVTVLVLHYFAQAAWPAILRRIADGLEPGEVFVNIDVFADLVDADGRLSASGPAPAPAPESSSGDEVDSDEWWRRLRASTDPAIAVGLEARSQMEFVSAEFHPDLAAYRVMLAEAGFTRVDVVDRVGAACIVVAYK